MRGCRKHEAIWGVKTKAGCWCKVFACLLVSIPSIYYSGLKKKKKKENTTTENSAFKKAL